MATYTQTRQFQYTAEQMFDLIADVERYPEFLPLWEEAQIYERNGDIYYTDQTIRLGLMKRKVRSRTMLQRPNRIDIQSGECFFGKFSIHWGLEELTEDTCQVGCQMQCEAGSPFLRGFLDLMFLQATPHIVAAFERRSREIYGPVTQSLPA
jgi:coenzyme Q-binding protein COQ10